MSDSADVSAPDDVVDPLQLYLRLAVSRDSSQDTIRRAYLQQSTVFHPDRAPADVTDEVREEMRRRFQQINEAYQILGDPRSRAAYDAAGTKGVKHLALVPENITKPAFIARYVDLLEQQSETLRKAKMLNASGNITIVFHAARAAKVFALPDERLQQIQVRAIERKNTNQQSTPTIAAFTTAAPTSTAAEAVTAMSATPSEPSRPSQEVAMASPPHHDAVELEAKLQTMQKIFTQRDIVVNGTPHIVLVPDLAAIRALSTEEFELLTRKPAQGQALTTAATSPGPVDGQSATAQPLPVVVVQTTPPALPRFVRFRSLFPDSIDASHGFLHPFRNGVMLFKAGCSQTNRAFSLWSSFSVEYHRSQVMTYFGKVRFAMREIQLRCGFLRELNALWSLRTELHLLDKLFFLPKFAVSLQRKWSPTWTLSNSLEWTLHPAGGSFSTTFSRGDQETDSAFYKVSLSPNGGLSLEGHYGTSGRIFEGVCDLPIAAGITGVVDPFNLRLTAITDLWYNKHKEWAFGLGLQVSAPFAWIQGPCIIHLRLLYRRGEQTVTLPLIIEASGNRSASYAWSTMIVPVLAYRLAMRAAVPYVRVRAIRDARRKRAEQQYDIRLEAERAAREVSAMLSAVHSGAAREDGIGGLVIRNARICLKRPLTTEELHAEVPYVADVTIALQNCVRQSTLALPSGPKGKLAGAYDPHPYACSQDAKVLRVEYTFRGRRHEVEIPEDEALNLPQESHLVRSATAFTN